MTERENHTEIDFEILAKVRPFLGREITPELCEQLLTAMLSVGQRYPSHQSIDLTSIVAKAMADSIGHGMREKCLEHAKAVILALDELRSPSALATAIEYVRWVMINLPIDFQMRDECPTDMLMHVLGFLQGLSPSPSSHVQWPIETEDQVEALARECSWDNRKYMTPADYSIWCERMRKFARLASPSPKPNIWGEAKAEDCVLSIGSQRVCAHGTLGCVNHHAPAPAQQVGERWLPIEQADRTITNVEVFSEVGVILRTSDRYWVRDEDGRVYEAAWSEGSNSERDYWWDFEGESPVDPLEFMPHPLDPRFAATEFRGTVEISPSAMELFTDLRAFFQMMAGKAATPLEQQFADQIRKRFADLRAAPDSSSLVQREGQA